MDSFEQLIQKTHKKMNTCALNKEFQKHQMLFIKNFLPEEWINKKLVPEAEVFEGEVHRVRVPGFKKSGSVSYHSLKKASADLYQIYKSPIMKKIVEEVVGQDLFCCPEDDAHGAALYYYTEPEDRIGVHLDTSFYKGARYTVLLGLVQDSLSSKLICYPGATKANKKKNPLHITTEPGSLVLFNGDVLWHEVSALGENEKRVIFTMEYLTDKRMSRFYKWVTYFKDKLFYFG